MKIKSTLLEADFSRIGAELQSLKFKGKEILWQTKENFWPQSAPVLFPFCGFLKNGFYIHENKQYESPVHGFAAHSKFQIESQSDTALTFALSHNVETQKQYPFEFKLSVSYELLENEIHVEFKVENLSNDATLPFSIGWHPGFNLSDNSYLKFDRSTFKKRKVSKEGLIGETEELKLKKGILTLNQNTFKNGGIVIENHNSEIRLHTPQYQIDFNFKDFPNLVLWGQPGADFICIEPWHGMGDKIKHNNLFIEKPDLISLSPDQSYKHSFSLIIKN